MQKGEPKLLCSEVALHRATEAKRVLSYEHIELRSIRYTQNCGSHLHITWCNSRTFKGTYPCKHACGRPRASDVNNM